MQYINGRRGGNKEVATTSNIEKSRIHIFYLQKVCTGYRSMESFYAPQVTYRTQAVIRTLKFDAALMEYAAPTDTAGEVCKICRHYFLKMQSNPSETYATTATEAFYRFCKQYRQTAQKRSRRGYNYFVAVTFPGRVRFYAWPTVRSIWCNRSLPARCDQALGQPRSGHKMSTVRMSSRGPVVFLPFSKRQVYTTP